MTPAQRLDQVRELRIGDLVFIPGHIMLVIGHDRQGPWVIHDSQNSEVVIGGRYQRLPTNGVAVTPLLEMAIGPGKSYIDAISAVQRIFPEGG